MTCSILHNFPVLAKKIPFCTTVKCHVLILQEIHQNTVNVTAARVIGN